MSYHQHQSLAKSQLSQLHPLFNFIASIICFLLWSYALYFAVLNINESIRKAQNLTVASSPTEQPPPDSSPSSPVGQERHFDGAQHRRLDFAPHVSAQVQHLRTVSPRGRWGSSGVVIQMYTTLKWNKETHAMHIR